MSKLEEYRINNHYSCQYMADRLNISKAFYWQIEKGKRRLSYDTACKIAKIFEPRPDEIFYEEYDTVK